MNNIKLFKLSSVRNTALYIYTCDDKGIYYFALTRKIPLGGRIRKNPNLNTCAV